MTDPEMLMRAGFFDNGKGEWRKCWWKSVLYRLGWRRGIMEFILTGFLCILGVGTFLIIPLVLWAWETGGQL